MKTKPALTAWSIDHLLVPKCPFCGSAHKHNNRNCGEHDNAWGWRIARCAGAGEQLEYLLVNCARQPDYVPPEPVPALAEEVG